MVTLNLALGLRMVRRASCVIHRLGFQPLLQITANVTGAIVLQQAQLVTDTSVHQTGNRQSIFQRACHIRSCHGGR